MATGGRGAEEMRGGKEEERPEESPGIGAGAGAEAGAGAGAGAGARAGAGAGAGAEVVGAALGRADARRERSMVGAAPLRRLTSLGLKSFGGAAGWEIYQLVSGMRVPRNRFRVYIGSVD